jgi:hypothetical protein
VQIRNLVNRRPYAPGEKKQGRILLGNTGAINSRAPFSGDQSPLPGKISLVASNMLI